MVILNRPAFSAQPQRSKGPPLIHYGSLQAKFTLFLTAISGCSIAIFSIAAWLMTSQNYELLEQLALRTSPQIVNQLNRELQLLAITLIVGTVTTSIGLYFVIHRRLSKIQGPLFALERQLRLLASGDWSARDIRIRREDEFQSLVGASNLLYQNLRAETLKEIEFLESIASSSLTPDAKRASAMLIKTKKDRLQNLKTGSLSASATVVNFAQSVEKRHVS